MSEAVESRVTPAAGVVQAVAVLPVAVSTLPALGVELGRVIPLMLTTLGLAAVPLRSPSSCIRPGAEDVALPAPAAGVDQAAAELEDAVMTWPELGVPVTATPFTLATVGLGRVPVRSPPVSVVTVSYWCMSTDCCNCRTCGCAT
jgi:hypothetical protein